MRNKRKTLRNKADKLFQQWFVAKNPESIISGKPTNLGHHYFPKSTASALRYEPNNMIPLTQGEHFQHHNGDPRIHAKVLEIKGIEWHKSLEEKKNTIIKPNVKYYKSIIEKFK